MYGRAFRSLNSNMSLDRSKAPGMLRELDVHPCCITKFVPFSLAFALPACTYSCDVGMDDLMMCWLLRRK